MKDQTLYRINDDIISLLQLAPEIGWNGIREMSISRMLYLSSVLYSFVNENELNPFIDDYVFTTDIRGPYCDAIEASLIYLLSNQYITKDEVEGIYMMGDREIPDLSKSIDHNQKIEWFRIIFFILGVYGEEKIYDFIYRDPEYEDKLQTKQPGINLEKGNETYRVLNQFRSAFESSIENIKDIKIEPKKYLELYFEYVFSTILKGEEDTCL